MDFLKKFTESENNSQGQGQGQQQNQASSSGNQQEGGSFFDKLAGKVNTAAGGGRESEKDEDYLDKGVDFVQEKFLGGGKQDNESAIEQAKDEQISDYIRKQYKGFTGSDLPIKDKPTRFG